MTLYRLTTVSLLSSSFRCLVGLLSQWDSRDCEVLAWNRPRAQWMLATVLCQFFFKIFFFWPGHIFKDFIDFVTILLLFYVLAFGHKTCLWDFSSPPREWSCTPCAGRQSCNHWSTREVPLCQFLSVMGPVRDLGETSGPEEAGNILDLRSTLLGQSCHMGHWTWMLERSYQEE